MFGAGTYDCVWSIDHSVPSEHILKTFGIQHPTVHPHTPAHTHTHAHTTHTTLRKQI